MKNLILFLLLILSFSPIHGQVLLNFELVSQNDFAFEVIVELDSNTDYQIKKLPPHTAISFSSISPVRWSNIKLVDEDGSQIALKPNHEDTLDFSNRYITELYQFNGSKQVINLSIKNYSGSLRIRGVYAPQIEIPEFTQSILTGGCQQPSLISQQVWRSGLPTPTIVPASTIVKHVIIHHSAGSNTDTNYLQTIRNIYLYHTQSNGWDDIGYNYLIAPNGLLFAGRDPQGVADQDDIRGAHFCSKNSNTMGICMLGTFTNSVPNQDAIDKLEDLLTWKMEKSFLNPTHFDLHPLGSNDALNTGIIDGHRSGCNTECPGTVFYQAFPQLRQNVLAKLQACSSIIASTNVTSKECTQIFSRGEWLFIQAQQAIKTWQLIDLQGKILAQGFNLNKESTLPFKDYSSGVYIIKLQTSDGDFTASKFVKH